MGQSEHWRSPIDCHESNHFIGARDNRWPLEALNRDTGESDFHYVIGGQQYNSLYAAFGGSPQRASLEKIAADDPDAFNINRQLGCLARRNRY